jgi:hypothetical protein
MFHHGSIHNVDFLGDVEVVDHFIHNHGKMDQVGGVNTRLSRNHTRIQGWIPLPILE